ncbi:hypothetical protein G3O06_23545 [Burkholderia sp. Ac-20345]|uniref:hypothetical protein n=1 Tax=Burkholderia sp. Ac-20345 TaxID=2703891 RepID=UPI00197B0F2D|nr:hypothetical protein [Burkholderia sp. Ac-20345]MBN3780492.1 hypothetical protein [Burkholderia sp. Ac-20345]
MTKTKSVIAAYVLLLSTAASASDLVLMVGIAPDAAESGRVVALRDTARDGCSYYGVYQTAAPARSDLMDVSPVLGTIKLERKQCRDLVSPADGTINLSRTHTYMDSSGRLRPGYQAGDAVGKIRSVN